MRKINFPILLIYGIIIFLMLPSLGFFLNIETFNLQDFSEILLELKTPLFNTILFCSAVTIISTILGSSLFWLVNFHIFKGVNYWKYLLFLPMLIPIYIAAYADAYFFEYSPFINKILNSLNIEPINFHNYFGATIVSSCSLYPYIYILMQSMFKKLHNIIIVSRINGYKSSQIYFQIMFSSARPVLIFGIAIVSMEIISEYGMSNQYGLNNLSNFLYRKWFYAHQYHYASITAIIIFAIIGIILVIEERNRRNNSYAANMPERNVGKFYLSPLKAFLANLYCFIVATFALFIPIGELIYLSIQRESKFFSFEILSLTINTLYIALTISILSIIIGYIINYLFNEHRKFKKLNALLKILITFSYGMPGAFIAISLIIWINKFSNPYVNWIIFGTIGGIVYGCLFRFISIAIYTINSGIITQKRELTWCKKIYGNSSLKCFFWCLPLYFKEISVVFLVVLIDSIKELPITLILRPANFSNLTIKAYELINDERYEEAAIPSLIIVALLAIISLVVLKLIHKAEH